jgi:hypothetical protein
VSAQPPGRLFWPEITKAAIPGLSGITALEAVGAVYTGGLVGGGPKRVENFISVTCTPRFAAMCPP